MNWTITTKAVMSLYCSNDSNSSRHTTHCFSHFFLPQTLVWLWYRFFEISFANHIFYKKKADKYYNIYTFTIVVQFIATHLNIFCKLAIIKYNFTHFVFSKSSKIIAQFTLYTSDTCLSKVLKLQPGRLKLNFFDNERNQYYLLNYL